MVSLANWEIKESISQSVIQTLDINLQSFKKYMPIFTYLAFLDLKGI